MVLSKGVSALLSPATGEQASALPWIIAGVGVLALGAFVVLTVLQKKNQKPTDPTSTQDPSDDDKTDPQ